MLESIERFIDQIPDIVVGQLIDVVKDSVARCGIYFRIFGRIKSFDSLKSKTQIKTYNSEHKLQDLFGIRIAVYFKDDIDICEKIIRTKFSVDEKNTHIDKVGDTEFKPTVMNIICKLPEDICSLLPKELFSTIIDKTFEIQIRTIFSEGWHEVEHDLRYKCKGEWTEDPEDSRTLNGIYATLVTCDWAIMHLFEERAYNKYRKEEWVSMLKNKFRIKFTNNSINNQEFTRTSFMKKVYKLDRNQVVLEFLTIKFPCTLDNFLYFINEYFIRDISIETPPIIKKECGHCRKSFDLLTLLV